MFSGRVGSRLARLYDDGEFRLARPQCDAHDAPGWRAAADPCLTRRRDVLRWILGSPFAHDGHCLLWSRSRRPRSLLFVDESRVGVAFLGRSFFSHVSAVFPSGPALKSG